MSEYPISEAGACATRREITRMIRDHAYLERKLRLRLMRAEAARAEFQAELVEEQEARHASAKEVVYDSQPTDLGHVAVLKERDALQKRVSELQAALEVVGVGGVVPASDEMRKERDVLRSRNAELQAVVAKLSEEMARLRDQRAGLGKRVAELEAMTDLGHTGVLKELDALRKRVDELERVEPAKDAVGPVWVVTRSDVPMNVIDELRKERDELRDKVQGAEVEYAVQAKERDKLIFDLNSLRQEFADELKASEAASVTLGKIVLERDALRQRVESQSVEIVRLTGVIDDGVRLHEIGGERMANMVRERDDLRAKLAAEEKNFEAMSKDRIPFAELYSKKLREQFDSEKEKLTKAIESLNKQCIVFNDERIACRDKMTKAFGELVTAKAACSGMSKRIRELVGENDILTVRLQALTYAPAPMTSSAPPERLTLLQAQQVLPAIIRRCRHGYLATPRPVEDRPGWVVDVANECMCGDVGAAYLAPTPAAVDAT